MLAADEPIKRYIPRRHFGILVAASIGKPCGAGNERSSTQAATIGTMRGWEFLEPISGFFEGAGWSYSA
jgi:hypothetical protein